MPGSTQTKSIAFVLAVFLVIVIVLWVIPLTPVNGLLRVFPWLDASHLLFILVPLILMAVLGRTRDEYGLRPSRWRGELAVGSVIALILIAAPILAEGAFGHLQLRKSTWGFVASRVVSKMLFVGFGEELLFRGFIQGELNRACPRRYQLGSVSFGWGVILTSILFGIAHLLNPFNPLLGAYGLDAGDFFLTAVIGFVLGLFREHYGSILAASLIHGAWDLTAAMIRVGAPGNLALGVALFGICLYCSLRVMASKSAG